MTTTIHRHDGGASAHVYTLADVKQIAEALGGARRRGDGSYSCRCPAHDDRNPSLTLNLGKSGKLLWHCHANCPSGAVLEALKERGLLNADGAHGHDPRWATPHLKSLFH